MKEKLYIIIPCYNEEKVLPVTAGLFLNELKDLIQKGKISDDSRILFVNDGSKDRTWDYICELAFSEKYFLGISQSRNRGHQNALWAGLMEVKDKADITITADCDGQDDINAMEKMVDAHHAGNEIVYGVRSSRDTDKFIKRITAEGFYKLMQFMGAEVIFNHADYRLLSSKVVRELANYKEVNLFLRGLIPLVGFTYTTVLYERQERMAGESRYSLRKLLALAFDGITSFSIKPIRMITGMGMCIAFFSFCAVIWSIFQYFMGETIAGWTSVTSILCFIGGLQLVSLGILGEYIGKIYLEVKARPRSIISDRVPLTLNNKEGENGKGE